MDPVTGMIIMSVLSGLGSYFGGGGSSQPEMPARGEYKGPSLESLQSLADMKNYMSGGGLGGGTVEGSGGPDFGGMDPMTSSIMKMMFGNLASGGTGQNSTLGNMFP